MIRVKDTHCQLFIIVSGCKFSLLFDQLLVLVVSAPPCLDLKGN